MTLPFDELAHAHRLLSSYVQRMNKYEQFIGGSGPEHMVMILEGESLFNDATRLVKAGNSP